MMTQQEAQLAAMPNGTPQSAHWAKEMRASAIWFKRSMAMR